MLDWELATLGEPMADLATMLTYWHDAADTERAPAVPLLASRGLRLLAGDDWPPRFH